jgi:16S rRNA (guanine527-N7)-methyltransferase
VNIFIGSNGSGKTTLMKVMYAACKFSFLKGDAHDAKDNDKAPPGRFSLVVFRAFKTLEQKILKKLFRLCDADGILAAYKGRREKIKEEMARLEKHCGKWEMIPCKTPFLEEERHLVIMERF